ncbi:uncharacterized protein LOC6046362 isoform X3 [Culex quinquefasciatus]|uniref:uncharacterized protein LOC6046362 isoform X3 n=1 Tax=Culex quinquefasciatus TaxID=7176 RepID=UPI0018E2DF65|nr:uncharacterized protein LOC6046362 isoform X3 [Culex quinquefasciatus]
MLVVFCAPEFRVGFLDKNIQISIILDTNGDDLLRSRRSSFFWQSDSTLSIRQPTYTKRRNPARTELQENVARTAILLVRNGLYHCHRSRQTAAATINSSTGFPAAGDQRHAYVQVAVLRRRGDQHVVAAQVFRDVGLPDRIDEYTKL